MQKDFLNLYSNIEFLLCSPIGSGWKVYTAKNWFFKDREITDRLDRMNVEYQKYVLEKDNIFILKKKEALYDNHDEFIGAEEFFYIYLTDWVDAYQVAYIGKQRHAEIRFKTTDSNVRSIIGNMHLDIQKFRYGANYSTPHEKAKLKEKEEGEKLNRIISAHSKGNQKP